MLLLKFLNLFTITLIVLLKKRLRRVGHFKHISDIAVIKIKSTERYLCINPVCLKASARKQHHQ